MSMQSSLELSVPSSLKKFPEEEGIDFLRLSKH